MVARGLGSAFTFSPPCPFFPHSLTALEESAMLNVFTLSNGRLVQVEIDQLSDLEQLQPI